MKQFSKQIILSMMTIVLSWSATAQVGIGTITPAATFDVVGNPSSTSSADGLIAPKITRAELIAKTAYGANQTGTILYVTDLTGTVNAATNEVIVAGYYFFDGAKWKNFAASSGQTANYAWSLSNAYMQGTIVTHNNLLYQANGVITANTPFAIGTTGATWREVSPAVQAWSSSNAYTANTLVSYGDLLYVSNFSIPANTVFTVGLFASGSTWRQVGIGQWRQESIYAAGAAVYRNNTMFFANGAIPSGTAFALGETGATWREAGSSPVIRGRVDIGDIGGNTSPSFNGDIAGATRTSGGSNITVTLTFSKHWGANSPAVSIGVNSLGASNLDNDFVPPVYTITGTNTMSIFIEETSSATQNIALSVIVFPN